MDDLFFALQRAAHSNWIESGEEAGQTTEISFARDENVVDSIHNWKNRFKRLGRTLNFYLLRNLRLHRVRFGYLLSMAGRMPLVCKNQVLRIHQQGQDSCCMSCKAVTSISIDGPIVEVM